MKKVVAFVPIKMNSQRLKNKNILDINGKVLCRYIFDTLLEVSNIDEVYVFCSDPIIKEYIPNDVCFLQRNKALDGDLVKGFDIYREFISKVDASIYVLAHATSPFLESESIEDAVSKVKEHGYDSAFSAVKYKTFAWYKGMPINYDINDVPRTQDIEPIYIETSGFFIFKKEVFSVHNRRIGFNPYIKEVSNTEAIDIDEKKDYDFACLIADRIKEEN